MTIANRHLDLWLSNFQTEPQDIVDALQVPAYLLARQGEPHGVRQLPARQNLVIFRHDFNLDASWSEVIEALIMKLGGWEKMVEFLLRLGRVDRIMQFTLPVKNSPHQENNFVSAATLGRLAQLEIDLGFEFGSYQERDDD